MKTKRVQILQGKAELQITETVEKKVRLKEADLERQLEYFEGMKAKAENGIAEVKGHLKDIYEAKGQ